MRHEGTEHSADLEEKKVLVNFIRPGLLKMKYLWCSKSVNPPGSLARKCRHEVKAVSVRCRKKTLEKKWWIPSPRASFLILFFQYRSWERKKDRDSSSASSLGLTSKWVYPFLWSADVSVTLKINHDGS